MLLESVPAKAFVEHKFLGTACSNSMPGTAGTATRPEPFRPQHAAFNRIQSCRLPALKCLKPVPAFTWNALYAEQVRS